MKSAVYMCSFITKDQTLLYSYYTKFKSICHLVWKRSNRSPSIPERSMDNQKHNHKFQEGKKFFKQNQKIN